MHPIVYKSIAFGIFPSRFDWEFWPESSLREKIQPQTTVEVCLNMRESGGLVWHLKICSGPQSAKAPATGSKLDPFARSTHIQLCRGEGRATLRKWFYRPAAMGVVFLVPYSLTFMLQINLGKMCFCSFFVS